MEREMDPTMTQDTALADRLRAVADDLRNGDPEFSRAVDAFVERLQTAEAGAEAPQVGEVLPRFVLPDQKGRLVSLEDILQGGPAIVTFLRGHWCPYCRVTASALGELQARAVAAGGRIVAITPESRKYVNMLEADSGGAFAILSDMDNGYALGINLAIWVDEEMARRITAFGLDVPSYNNDPSWTLPIPAAFVVDREGIVRARHVNPDYRERANYESMIAAVADLSR